MPSGCASKAVSRASATATGSTRRARARGLRGWVRNRLDGSVEALLIGDTNAVEEMIAACQHGPRMAAVTAVQRSTDSDDGSTDFRQMPTV